MEESRKIRQKRYYVNHREQVKKRARKYREKHREYFREYNRKYYLKNKDKIILMSRESYKRNRKRQAKRSKERRLKFRKEIEKALGSKCSLCGSKENTHFHEIHGKNHYSTNRSMIKNFRYIIEHLEDFVSLCCKCHMIIHKIVRVNMIIEKMVELIEILSQKA